jgi:hypothetical protein
MALDLPRVVDSVRNDLKKLYRQDPSAVWQRPFVVIAQDGKTSYLDSEQTDEVMAEWLVQFRGPRRISAVVVGRMVVKYGGVLDASGQPTIKERAILVSGRSFTNGRTVVSITPTREFRDFRSPETIEAQGSLPNPGITSPDTTKMIVDEFGKIAGHMVGQFGEEQRFDSNKGQHCVLDPLIRGVLDAPNPLEGKGE